MPTIESAVIGGSGFYQLDALEKPQLQTLNTPFGEVVLEVGCIRRGLFTEHANSVEPPIEPQVTTVDEQRTAETLINVAVLARHAKDHKVPPHKVNYRANLWALRSLGVKRVFAINAVGGIGSKCGPGVLVIPDQIVDYTYGREHTFADTLSGIESHIDFTWPYDESSRQMLIGAAKKLGESVLIGGCYGCTQGPRLETAAEIQRLARDGNTLVGMTAMPEAALARELGIQYASLCIVANWAAGLTEAPISVPEMMTVLGDATEKAQRIIHQALLSSL